MRWRPREFLLSLVALDVGFPHYMHGLGNLPGPELGCLQR